MDSLCREINFTMYSFINFDFWYPVVCCAVQSAQLDFVYGSLLSTCHMFRPFVVNC